MYKKIALYFFPNKKKTYEIFSFAILKKKNCVEKLAAIL